MFKNPTIINRAISFRRQQSHSILYQFSKLGFSGITNIRHFQCSLPSHVRHMNINRTKQFLNVLKTDLGKFLLIIFILVAVNLHNVELSLKDYMLLRNTHLEAFSACHTPFRLHYFWLCCDKMFFIESKVPMLQPKLYRLHVEFVVFA